MSITCVYDRTLQDIITDNELETKIKENGFDSLTESETNYWNSGLKTRNNYTDWNRVESNCKTIANMANISITTKTNWAKTDFINSNDINRILENVSTIRRYNDIVYTDTPITPNSPINTIEKMNNIEKILYDKYNIIYNNIINKYYCGESIYCGNVLI